MPAQKRKRRTVEEAREEILDAAETIILSDGPAALKFQSLAQEAKVTVSNVHHHFGGVLEIKRALAARVLAELGQELATALTDNAPDNPHDYAGQVLTRIYGVLSTKRLSRLIGWIVLSTEIAAMDELLQPLPMLKMLVADRIAQYLSAEAAERLAGAVVYQVAITAIGDGLVGDGIKAALGESERERNGAAWLTAHWSHLLRAELDAAGIPAIAKDGAEG